MDRGVRRPPVERRRGAVRRSHGRQALIAPDDGNLLDQTVLAVPLPQPVEPGATVRVEVAWTTKIPRTFARTGAIGDYYFIAQWFPKLGVLEETGWNCHQFHAGTEFYLRFRRLRRPHDGAARMGGRRHRHASSGAPRIADGTTTHATIRKPTSTTSRGRRARDYVERAGAFEHPALPPVEMRLLLQPEHAGQAERHFAGDARRPALLRRVVRRLSLRPRHDRRSRLSERRRRHGISDAVHGRHAVAGARAT